MKHYQIFNSDLQKLQKSVIDIKQEAINYQERLNISLSVIVGIIQNIYDSADENERAEHLIVPNEIKLQIQEKNSPAGEAGLIEETSGFLKFTEKEILKMPEYFRKIFRTDGVTGRIRVKIRKNGKKYFEIRYRRDGYNICVGSGSLLLAKRKFMIAIQEAVPVIRAPKAHN